MFRSGLPLHNNNSYAELYSTSRSQLNNSNSSSSSSNSNLNSSDTIINQFDKLQSYFPDEFQFEDHGSGFNGSGNEGRKLLNLAEPLLWILYKRDGPQFVFLQPILPDLGMDAFSF